MIKKSCRQCNKDYYIYPYRINTAIFCSKSCLSKSKIGPKGSHWKGGKQKTGNGYIQLLLPKHPNSDSRGRVYEHRYMMEVHLKRMLKENEVVHHLNGNRGDNRIENLKIYSNNGKHLSDELKNKLPKVNLDGKYYNRWNGEWSKIERERIII